MRWISGLLLVSILLAFDSCFEAPHFADTPEIEFENLVFKDPANSVDADSLILTINFKDGDGDLGLGSDENFSPFNDKIYFLLDGTPIYFDAGTNMAKVITDPNYHGQMISFLTKRTASGYDTLPDLVTPYDCTNWEVVNDSLGHALDTLYYKLNTYHYNIFVDFYIKRNDSSNQYDLYDWKSIFHYPNCQVNGFYGRFPILAKNVNDSAPQEGKIRYSMRSVAFKQFFSIKILQLHIYILDRHLHQSNVIITDDFSLQSILVPS